MRAQAAPVHGGQHLDVPDGVHAEAPGDALGHHLEELVVDFLGRLRRDEVEVLQSVAVLVPDGFAGIDAVGVHHDAGGSRLPEDLREPHRRHLPGLDDVLQHRSRPHRRELVHVPHQQHGGVGRHRLEQLVHQQDVHHGHLVDHQQVRLQGIGFVLAEAPVPGIELKQPMNGPGLGPSGLREALGGASGGSAQQHPGVARFRQPQNAVDDGGLPDPGSSGQHGDLAVEHDIDGLALRSGKTEPGQGFHPRYDLVSIDGAPGRRPVEQAPELAGDAGLGPEQRRQEKRRFSAQRLAHQVLGGHLEADGLLHGLRGNIEQFHRPFHEVEPFRRAMPFAGTLPEHVVERRPYPDQRIGRNAEFACDAIGGDKADAADVQSQAVGIFPYPLDGLVAVHPVDARRPGAADAVGVEEHHDLADRLLLAPGLGDARLPLRADAVQCEQAFRLSFDDLEHLGSEGLDQLMREMRTDAPDESGAQVLLHSFECRRRDHPQRVGPKLKAVGGVVHPRATALQLFAGIDRGGIAHHRYELPPAAHPHLQDAEARVHAVKGDSFHQTLQGLADERRLIHRSSPNSFRVRLMSSWIGSLRVSSGFFPVSFPSFRSMRGIRPNNPCTPRPTLFSRSL